MNYFLKGFEKTAKFIQKNPEPSTGHKALAVGSGVAATGAVAQSFSDSMKDRVESKVKSSRSLKDFSKKLKKGDVIYSGYNPKDSFSVMLGKKKLPLKVSQMVQMATGNPNYHGMVYLGKGLVGQAEGEGMPLAIRKLHSQGKGQRMKAYRPKASKKEIDSAVNYVKKVKGTRYKNIKETATQGAEMLFRPGMGPKTCRKTKGGIVCNTLVTKAYPKQFKRENMSVNQVRKTKGTKFIGSYGKISKSPIADKVINKVIHPTLKNLKWGLGAGALAYGGMKLRDYIKKRKAAK